VFHMFFSVGYRLLAIGYRRGLIFYAVCRFATLVAVVYFVSRGQPNDLCPIFGVSSGYLRDKCRYSLLQTKTAIPSISGITVLDRNKCKILLINHTLRDDAMDIYSVIYY
jgi:hypothetical protein